MKRRDFLKNSFTAASATLFPQVFINSCGGGRARPNMVFLFTDDQRFDTIHALDNPRIQTPNMDRLVRRGLSFTRAHIMGGTSGAVCMPSRAMLLTGKSLFHLQNQGAGIPEDHIMFPEVLKEQGYKTFATGKWHNGRAAYARCFTDGGKIMFGGMSNHLKVPVYDFDVEGKYPPEKMYYGRKFSSEMFSDEAIRFIQEQDPQQRFFAYVSYTAPHDPRMAPQEFAALYPPEEIELPANFMPRHPFDNGEMAIRDENLAPFPRTPDVVREHIAAYYAMISHLDFHLGRVLDALEMKGLIDNTVIILAGDNGLAVGQHGLMGKQNLYDHSVRVPLIMCGPGIPGNVRSKALVYLNDIYPTLMDLLKTPLPPSVEGKSLLPVIKNPGRSHRSALFLAYTHIQRAVRTDDNWKLIRYNVKGKQSTQLFNLNDDPRELHNLAGQRDVADREDQLTALLRSFMRQYDDFCDLDKPNWGLPEEKDEVLSVNHLAVKKPVTLQNQAVIKYSASGIGALTDGLRATVKFNDGHWAGLEGDDLDVVVDLEGPRNISRVSVGFLEDQGSWIFFPREVQFLASTDGRKYFLLHSVQQELKQNNLKQIQDYKVKFSPRPVRFVRIKAKNIGRCPKWHSGYGGKSWLFADEILVDQGPAKDAVQKRQ